MQFACAVCPQVQPDRWPTGLRLLTADEVRPEGAGYVHVQPPGFTHRVRVYADDPELVLSIPEPVDAR